MRKINKNLASLTVQDRHFILFGGRENVPLDEETRQGKNRRRRN